ncbi:MAG: DegT/DnrJ/EryC1/StrS family aminotransferase [Spirochaetales bacterium]|nr:DegT/DnrJ/EryC1/StrS family aminotransferase [Spirochaetales bacterium]
MAVPFIDLKRFEPGFLVAWQDKVAAMSANTAFMGGPEIERLETRLASASGVAHAITCANGTDALQLALRACGVGPGACVLLPDFTFWATYEAIVNVGASPVTVDINPADLQMDWELMRKACDLHRPAAIILVHLYGWGSERLLDFRQFCQERSIKLIEDGAQSFGTHYRGQSIYKGAQLSTVSFYPAKVLGGAGDGGAVLTDDADLASRIRTLANHGRASHYSYDLVGWNSRLDSLQAAYLNLCMDHIEARLSSRRLTADFYRSELSPPSIQPPEGYNSNAYLYACIHEPAGRERWIQAYQAAGIGYATTYPGSISEQAGAREHLKDRVGGEEAVRLSRMLLNPPLFPYMTDAERSEVVEVRP